MTSWCPKEQLWSFNFCNIRQTLQVTDLRGKKRVEWVCFCHHKTSSSATGAGDSGYFWEGWCSAACRHTLWLGGGELRLSASAFRRRNEPLLPWSCNNTQTWWRVCFDLRTHRCLVSLIVSLHSLLCFFNPFIMASHQPLPLLSTPPLSAFVCSVNGVTILLQTLTTAWNLLLYPSTQTPFCTHLFSIQTRPSPLLPNHCSPNPWAGRDGRPQQ